jgi:hypothetical protein
MLLEIVPMAAGVLVDSSGSSPAPRGGGLAVVRRRLLRPTAVALWLAPLAVLLADRGWLLPTPWRDPWIYYGYFRHAAEYVHRFPGFYFSTRLSVILPGYAALSLLAEPYASLALHAAMLGLAGGCFSYVARRLCGDTAGACAAILFLGDPFLLRAVGENYVDGFGILYFLAAAAFVVLAGERSRVGWLAAAGGAALAMVVANLFYAVQLPWLAALWWLRRDRRRAPSAALRDGLVFGAGLGATLVALGAASLALGGRFWFLGSSLDFAATATSWVNPYRHPLAEWMPAAHWLVVPALVFALATASAWRSWRSGASRRAAVGVQYVAFALLFIGFQLRRQFSPLEFCFYSSLLLAPAYLALGGVLSSWVEDWQPRRRTRAYALTCVGGILALSRWVPAPLPGQLGDTPAFLSLAACIALLLAGAVRIGRRRWAAAAAIAAVTMAHWLARESPFLQLPGPLAGESKAPLFAQMTSSVRAIEDASVARPVRLWYDLDGPYGKVFDAVACSFLLTPNLVNSDFPSLHDGRLVDGGRLAPGQRIALLSERSEAVELAQDEARSIGLAIGPVSSRAVPGPVPGFAIHVMDIVAGDPESRPPSPARVDLQASDPRLSTLVGKYDDSTGGLESDGRSGYLQFGPYLRLTPGVYEVLWEGEVRGPRAGWAEVDVVHDAATSKLGAVHLALSPTPPGAELARLRFEVREEVLDAEFRFLVGPEVIVSLTAVRLRRLPAADRPASETSAGPLR